MATFEGNDLVLSPILTDAQEGQIEYANFDYTPLGNIIVSDDVDMEQVRQGGVVLALVATVVSDEIRIRAVPSDIDAKFICEERKLQHQPKVVRTNNKDRKTKKIFYMN